MAHQSDRYSQFVKTEDYFYPNFDGEYALMSVTLLDKVVGIHCFGADDFGYSKHMKFPSAEHAKDGFDTWVKEIQKRDFISIEDLELIGMERQ